jgi:predicted lipoprotein with Yx(FWY)xxD motif
MSRADSRRKVDWVKGEMMSRMIGGVAALVGTGTLMLALAGCGANGGSGPSGASAAPSSAPVTSTTAPGKSGSPVVSESVSPAQEAPETVPPLKVGPATLAVTRHTFARERTELVDIPGGTFEILTVNGKAAYRFELDGHKPAKVNCLVDCPITWPPVIVNDAKITSLPGVDRSLVGTVKRPDGHQQVTYNGWPLYWFFEDKTSADAKGEGLGSTWSAIKPDGKPVFKKNP